MIDHERFTGQPTVLGGTLELLLADMVFLVARLVFDIRLLQAMMRPELAIPFEAGKKAQRRRWLKEFDDDDRREPIRQQQTSRRAYRVGFEMPRVDQRVELH